MWGGEGVVERGRWALLGKRRVSEREGTRVDATLLVSHHGVLVYYVRQVIAVSQITETGIAELEVRETFGSVGIYNALPTSTV
jgi:hypothetical protein